MRNNVMLIMCGYLDEFPPEYEEFILEKDEELKFGINKAVDFVDRDWDVFQWMTRSLPK